MDGDAIPLLFALGIGIIGALIFVLGIEPSLSLNGGSTNMPLVVLGVALIIIAAAIGALIAAFGKA